MNPKDDGITHINIYSKGKTELGRLLSNFADTPFVHPRHGKFKSVEGFWYWLSTGMVHEQLRDLTGYEAKKYGKSMVEDFGIKNNPSFNDEILEAIRCKLRQNRSLLDMLKESTLPLEHYYCYGDKVIELPQYRWIVDEIERIRQVMKDA